MKKINKALPKLKFNSKKILVLTQSQMDNVNAGDGNSVFTRPVTWDCVAPYNAPPFLTQKYCND
ncbi:hypothetical protein [Taibaiella chishuiensis]|uniref:Uncharacterized protein n=1 Tax=Taibaiella chishuiensis TaxID=1434707 RepID=A0A2P8D7F4_9BACT|nr:hypothetical protein [Taibaiella chishuiensis]PSK93143.1 hypothetical protein B0I18_102113 [Taibaiella chishuiensis]